MAEEANVPREERPKNAIQLEPNTILQINTTIIAGALILLKLGSTMVNVPGKETIQYTLTLLTIVVIIPFSISSLWLLKEKGATLDESKK